MSVLQKEILLVGSRGSRRCSALFDSGSSYSIVRRDIAESLQPLSPLANPDDWVFETAKAGDTLRAAFSVALTFRFDDSAASFTDIFIVIDECSEQVVIGAKTLQSSQIVLDFKEESILYRKTAERLRI